ncbi:MAG: DUF4197 domain-containing protein [Bacteroidales bacterium]
MKVYQRSILLAVISVVLAIGMSSCEDTLNPTLTESEVIQGLKSALSVSTDTAVVQTHRTDGFFKDASIKILMPPDARVLVENISYVPGGQALLDKVILLMNRAAEDAAGEAGPIFKDAIVQMSVADAWGILNGVDTAATHYLRLKTYDKLLSAFQPVVFASLNKELLPGVTPLQAWTDLTTSYNSVANSFVGQLAGLTPVNSQLDVWVTRRALEGLFHKMAAEEISIRHDPWARVNDILRKVFQ